MRTFSQFSMVGLVLAAVLTGCGGGDLTLPADGLPATLRAMSGSGQQATIGTQLPNPLVVRVTDGAARPVAGVAVNFRFQSAVPGAQFDPATATTNDTGFASVQVRLGNTAGDQTIEAAISGTSSPLSATFGVTALAAPSGGGDGGRPRNRGRGHGGGGDDDDD
jgi:Big-like domain-containing protein